MSSFVDAVGDFAEGVGGAIGSLGKSFKSALGSEIGKVALLGAMIYTGYLAFQPGGWFAAESGVLGAEKIAGTGLMEGLSAAGTPAEVALAAAPEVAPGVEAVGGYGGPTNNM